MNSAQLFDSVQNTFLEKRTPQVFCFDFFDTLVERTVFPEATKQLSAKHIASILGNSVTYRTVYEIRSCLEKQLCLANQVNGFDLEFSLTDLGDKLFSVLKTFTAFPAGIDREHFLRIFIDIEVQTETSLQRPLPEQVKLVRFIKEKGLKTCLISDFYIPQKIFKRILSYHGFDELFDEIFISADHKVTKGGSGRLYQVVSQCFDCPADKMIMIGDNVHADVKMAKHAGLDTLHLDRSEQHEHYTALIEMENNHQNSHRTLDRTFNETFTKYRSTYFAEMGLSLWLFTHNLFATLLEDHVEKIFFCSKEGEFLRKLFIQYQEQRFGSQIISCNYLLVSRKATFICSLKALEEEDFSRLFVGYSDLSFKEFLLSLNFSEKVAREVCAEHNLEYEIRYPNLRQQLQFKGLLSSQSFGRLYESHRQEQRTSFSKYLARFGVDIENQGFTLVDVGWKGSIQNNIFYSLGGKTAVRGYYLGLLSPTEIQPLNEKKGILFRDVPVHSPYIHVYNNNRSLFEMLLGATHGSADGYFTRDVFELLKKIRNSTELVLATPGDDLVVSVLDLPQERELYETKIRPIQEAMLALNHDLTEEFCRQTTDIPSLEWFARHHARMVFSPSAGEVDFFSALYHLENFGLFEFTNFQSDQNKSALLRLKNFIKLVKNPGGVLETGIWPPVILKRLGLAFLQPVDAKKRYKRVFGDGEG